MSEFIRYLGIDYSGAETAEASRPGIRVYEAAAGMPAREIGPPPSPRKYWSRRELAFWLRARLTAGPATMVGIDHAFSFPLQYFEAHRLALDWTQFLDDFQRHWPTDEPHTYVDFIRNGRVGNGAARQGNSKWRRLTELRSRTAKSVFHFDVQGSVAKSTHAGLPWLRFLRNELGRHVHFWPFDGWIPPQGKSVIAEVYPSLWRAGFPREQRNEHQHDAFSIAQWLHDSDAARTLPAFFEPQLTGNERTTAAAEGWILGVR